MDKLTNWFSRKGDKPDSKTKPTANLKPAQSGQSIEDENAGREPDLRAVFGLIHSLLHRRRGLILFGIALVLLNKAASLVLPSTTKYVIDEVVGHRNLSKLPIIVGVAILASFAQGLTAFGMARILSRGAQEVIGELRVRLQAHVGGLALSFYDRNKVGTLVARVMNDVEGIWSLFGTGFIDFAGSVVTALLAFAMLLFINARLTVVVSIFLLAFVYALNHMFKIVRPIYKVRSRVIADVTGRLAESIGGVRVIKGYGAEKYEAGQFAHGISEIVRVIFQVISAESILGLLSASVISLTGIWVVYAGIHMVVGGKLSLGSYFTYNIFLAYLIAPLASAVNTGTQLNTAFVGLDRALEVLREPDEHSTPDRVIRLSSLRGAVRFEDVNFSYVQGKPVLHDISLSASPNQVIALVGPSGSGKSTIASLLCAFHVPDSGCVLVDDVDLSRVTLADYRRHLGVVFQDTFLFHGSIRENVAFARPGAEEEEIVRVCKIARVNEFAEQMSHGYDTIIGERGVTLSGGQKQRVAIARALLADPRILILDEATSSLDSESEQMVQAGLAALMQGRTTIVIAHRLSTIEKADQILVLEKGRIVERGTHSDLLIKAGRYRKLHDSQYRGIPGVPSPEEFVSTITKPTGGLV